LGRVDYSLVDMKRPIKFINSSEQEETEKKLERIINHSTKIKAEMAKPGKQDEVKAKELKFLESKQKELEKAFLLSKIKIFTNMLPSLYNSL